MISDVKIHPYVTVGNRDWYGMLKSGDELRWRRGLLRHFNVEVVLQYDAYRAGIADGGEFYIRPPGTAAWLFDKVKY